MIFYHNYVTIPLDMQLLDEAYRLWIQGTGRGEEEDSESREEEGVRRPCQGSSVRVQILRRLLCMPRTL
jgi:hypothetical protein